MTLQELTAAAAGKKEGRLILLGSRPGMGKSSVALGMALKLAAEGKKVDYISCTEKKAYLTQHLEFINNGKLSEAQQQNIICPEPAKFSAEDIAAFCNNEPDAVFVDSLQDLNGTIAELLKSLKELSNKLNCPVVVLSGLSEKIDKRLFSKKPRVADLADSGIDAGLFDETMLFFRDSRYNPKAAKDKCSMIINDREENCVWSDITNCIK